MIHTNLIIIAVLLSLLFTFIIYLIYASAHSKWPFQKKTNYNSKYTKIVRDSSISNGGQMSPILGVLLCILFFGFFIFIMYLAMKANVARYSLASQALKSGQGGVAAAALAPEIGQGLGDLLYGGYRN